jgi:hypothetical protein
MAGPNEPSVMNRRDALRAMAVGVGAAASAVWVAELALLAEEQAAHAHLLAVAPQGGAWTPSVLSARQMETVGTLVELIIPTTETPGAKAALVDRYIDGVLGTATPDIRKQFLAGLEWVDTRSRALFKVPFNEATPDQQTDLLTRLSREGSTEDAVGTQFFTAIKAMTITGYYTTEIGLKQELGNDFPMVMPFFEGCDHPEHQI